MADDNPEQLENQRLERKGADRRTHVDRRRTVAPWTGAELRRVNRRNAIDRRGLPFGIFYKTSDPLTVLYGWLRNQCYGKWSVGIEPVEDDSIKNSVKVLFELESDKDTFMTNVMRG